MELLHLTPDARRTPPDVSDSTLCGGSIRARLTTAGEEQRSIGGIKVVTDHGWFAARPSDTEAYSRFEPRPSKIWLTAPNQEEAHAIIQTAIIQTETAT